MGWWEGQPIWRFMTAQEKLMEALQKTKNPHNITIKINMQTKLDEIKQIQKEIDQLEYSVDTDNKRLNTLYERKEELEGEVINTSSLF